MARNKNENGSRHRPVIFAGFEPTAKIFAIYRKPPNELKIVGKGFSWRCLVEASWFPRNALWWQTGCESMGFVAFCALMFIQASTMALSMALVFFVFIAVYFASNANRWHAEKLCETGYRLDEEIEAPNLRAAMKYIASA